MLYIKILFFKFDNVTAYNWKINIKIDVHHDRRYEFYRSTGIPWNKTDGQKLEYNE